MTSILSNRPVAASSPCIASTSALQHSSLLGCAQDFVATPILRDLPECDELCFGRDHSLGFEEQVAKVLVSAPAVDQHPDVAVDGFHHAEPYFGAAVVEDPIQVSHQRVGQFLKREQALPAELIHPCLQVAYRRAFVLVLPEMFQRLLQ